MLRVLLADDQTWLRSAMRLLLEQDPALTIIGEAAEIRSLLVKVSVAKPDILLLDWELPGFKRGPLSHETLLKLRQLVPNIHIIALSGLPTACEEALEAGVDYFVSKADPPEALLSVIKAVKQSEEDASLRSL